MKKKHLLIVISILAIVVLSLFLFKKEEKKKDALTYYVVAKNMSEKELINLFNQTEKSFKKHKPEIKKGKYEKFTVIYPMKDFDTDKSNEIIQELLDDPKVTEVGIKEKTAH